jgi:chemotaxis protein histidine kinase CheA
MVVQDSQGFGELLPLVSVYADDPEMVELITDFVRDLHAQVRILSDALTRGDLPTITRAAHTLKGAGGGYGFMPISQAAALVERAARDRGPELPARLDELVFTCRRAMSAHDAREAPGGGAERSCLPSQAVVSDREVE